MTARRAEQALVSEAGAAPAGRRSRIVRALAPARSFAQRSRICGLDVCTMRLGFASPRLGGRTGAQAGLRHGPDGGTAASRDSEAADRALARLAYGTAPGLGGGGG